MNTQAVLGRRSTFVRVVVAVALSAFIATAYALWRLRVETIDRQLDTAAMTARALEDHLTQSFNIIDRTLVNLAESDGAAADYSSALRHAPYLRSLALLGETGEVAASSDPRNVGMRLDRADFLPLARSPVEVLRVGPLKDGRDFHDARPVSPASPNPVVSFLPVERDVRLANERWTTVAASVNADYFLNFYSSHIAADEGMVQLLRYDGRLLLSTDESELAGTLGSSVGILSRIGETEVGRFEESLGDGRAVLTAYRASRAYPFVLVVRLDKENVLTGWRNEALGTFTIVSAILLAALALASLYFVRFERVARERERDQERLRIAAIAFESREGMVVTSADALVLQINKAFTDITGYSSDDVVGQKMNFMNSAQHDASFFASIWSSLERTGAWAGEIRNRHRDGTIHPHYMTITAVHGNDGRVTHHVATLADITERKQAEESLRTLSRAVEQSPVSTIITDVDGSIQYVNPKFEEATGYTFAEIIGQNPRILGSGEKTRAEYQEMWGALLEGKTWKGEFHNRRKDGTLFWEQASISPVFSDEGVFLHFVAVKEDITERKAAEAAIAESQNLLLTIINAAPVRVFWKDTDLRYLGCNTMFSKDAGNMRSEDMIGKDDYQMSWVAQAEMYRADDLSVMKTGVAKLSYEEPQTTPDGRMIWLRTSKVPLRNQVNEIIGLLGIYDDITEHKQAEEQLHLAASVFAHSREGIMITAADGRILDANDAFSHISGYSRDEVLGQNPRILSSGRQKKEFYAAMWHNLIEKGHWYGEVWNRRKNGEVYAEMLTISAVRDVHGNTRHYVALFSDITQLKEHERQLEHIAHYDALTTLPNRVLLSDRLHQSMAQAQRRGQQLAVAYLDLDGFKAINDSHGHEAGDQLLMTVAARMKQALREGDTLARLGGDEFVAVLLDLADVSASVPMLTRLLAAAAEPVHVGGNLLQVSASVGVTFYPQAEDMDADQLLRQADQAMYQAKLAGRNRFHVFDADQDRSVRGHHESLEHIRHALTAHEFVLYYQPKVNMRSGAIIGAEALIRWQHPEKGLLPPAVFLPVIEDHPLSIELGEWVIHTALSQIEAWRAQGLDIPVSVNVGARQLQQVDFVNRLREILAAHPQVRPSSLELEVLETSALEDLNQISQVIEACREIGVMFALDDFGTGYSSLTYLRHLPVTQLKIDQSFVRDMLDDPDDLAILEGVIGLATAFRRQVIAEGVETVEHGAMLLQLGCELAQGYGIARPMPAHDFPAWSERWKPYSAWADMLAVSRDDLPLLFASVEHRAWILAMENHLKGEREAPPPLDHHQCRFGSWMDTEGQARHGAQSAFQAIEPLHQRVHALAAELRELHAQDRSTEALTRLGELHDLRDTLLEKLQVLVRKNAD